MFALFTVTSPVRVFADSAVAVSLGYFEIRRFEPSCDFGAHTARTASRYFRSKRARLPVKNNTGKSVCHARGASCTRFVCTDIIGKSGIKVQSENSFCQIKQESADISKHRDKVFTGASDIKWPNAQTVQIYSLVATDVHVCSMVRR